MDSRTHRCSRCIHCNLSWDFHQSGLSNTRNASLVKDSCEPQQIQVDVAVRVFGPDVCRLGSAESCPQSCSGRLMTPAAGSRARGLDVRPYVSASAARWPVGPAALWTVVGRSRCAVPMVLPVVALPMVRVVARPVYHRRSPAAPGPY
jgi:hypothetical protein